MGRHPHPERDTALRLARRHPGWSTARIGREVGADRSSVCRWLAEAGLAPSNPRVRRGDGPRGPAVELVCGHLGVAPAARADATGWCWRCRRVVALGPDPRRELEEHRGLNATRARSGSGAERPPDTAPPDPTPPHFSERPVVEVIADLIEQWRRRGQAGTDVDAIVAEELRRAGIRQG